MNEHIPARTIEGRVEALFQALDENVTGTPVEALMLTYEGIPGERHSGLIRPSGPREPWYERGTPMRNERQLSILSLEELAEVAAALDIAVLEPNWIGGNIAFSGISRLSQLPPRTLMMFPSGAAIRIDGDNGPCRVSGRSIAAHTGHAEHEFAFVKAAKYRRGLVGWVEREGEIRRGDVAKIRIWEQALYPG
ncbi:MAG: molybdenum cofactor sulfurase [Devosia sp.]